MVKFIQIENNMELVRKWEKGLVTVSPELVTEPRRTKENRSGSQELVFTVGKGESEGGRPGRVQEAVHLGTFPRQPSLGFQLYDIHQDIRRSKAICPAPLYSSLKRARK